MRAGEWGGERVNWELGGQRVSGPKCPPCRGWRETLWGCALPLASAWLTFRWGPSPDNSTDMGWALTTLLNPSLTSTGHATVHEALIVSYRVGGWLRPRGLVRGGVGIWILAGSFWSLCAFPQNCLFTLERFQANPLILQIKEKGEEAASCWQISLSTCTGQSIK